MKFIDLAKNLSNALKKWKSQGYPVVTKGVLNERLELCRDCKWWQELGNSTLARCRACGCSSAKLLMGTTRCPLNPPRWKESLPEKEEE